jgi:hypothetical protein
MAIEIPIDKEHVIARAVKKKGKTVGHKIYKSDGLTQLTEQDYKNYAAQCMKGKHVLVLLEQKQRDKTYLTLQGLFSVIFKVKGVNA